MSPPDTHGEGLELISKLLDDAISESEFARLHDLMVGDASLRKLYIQSVDQEVELFCRGEEVTTGLGTAPKRRANLLLPIVAICIAITLAVISIIYDHNRRNPPPVTGGGETPGTGEVPVPPPPIPELRKIPAAPETWTVDFEGGLPEGWEAKFVQSGLPEGSRGGAATIAKNDSGKEFRNLTPPQSWSPGKFEIGENTHLHLVMKVESGAYFNFFMLTHVPDPERDETSLYQFTDTALWASEGRWLHVSIPVAEFSRKDQLKGEFVPGLGPDVGEVAWQLFLSSATPDLSLVVDEIRVDNEGPGKFEIRELE